MSRVLIPVLVILFGVLLLLKNLFNWNISLFKGFPLTSKEGPRFELRFESFNTFNQTQWNQIDTGLTDSKFGQVTSTYDPRVLQFGGKFLF